MKVIQRESEEYIPEYQYIFAIGKGYDNMKSINPIWKNETKQKSFIGELYRIRTILNIEVSDGKESQESIS